MRRIFKRYLAFMMAFTLVATNFSGNFASARVYAVADEEDLEEQVSSSDDDSIFESLADIVGSEDGDELENPDVDESVEEGSIDNQEGENTDSEDVIDEASAGSDLIDSEISEKEKNEGSEIINKEEISLESATLGNTVLDSVEEKASSSDSASVVVEKESSESVSAATLATAKEVSASSTAASITTEKSASSEAATSASILASLAASDAASLASSDAASLASTDAAALASTEEEEEDVEFSPAPVIINGIKITLYAKSGVLPNDAVLEVEAVDSSLEKKIEDAIDSQTTNDVEVKKTISFDIKIYSESEGGYVQPEEGTVRVTFEEISEAATDDVTLEVYHVAESDQDVDHVEKVEDVDESAEGTALGFDAEHFSIYSIVLIINKTSNKVGLFYLDPVDENGKNIEITNIGATKIALNENKTITDMSEIALVLPGYKFKKAYVRKWGHFWNIVEAEITKIEANENEQKIYFYSEYEDLTYTDSVDWVEDTDPNMGGYNAGFRITFEYESEETLKESDLVYFFVLLEGKKLPENSAGQDTNEYYPEKGSHYDTNTKWLGRAVPLKNIPEELRDGYDSEDYSIPGGNLWDVVLDTNGHELSTSGNKVRQYIKSLPKDDVNAYFASNDDLNCFTEDDISWYVYKRQLDALHIDGFINTSVKYHSNYTGGPASIEDKLRYMTNHTVRGEDTFTREGYIFKGWSLTAGEGNTPDSNYDPTKTITVGKKLNLYAVWEKDPVLEAAISVELNPGVWFYDGKEHTNNTDYTVDYGTTTGYVVKSITTDGSVKNRIQPTTDNNHITSVTIEDTIKHKTYVLNVNKDNTCETKDGGPSKVTVKHSTLTVKPRTVTLTSESLKKVYDGTYLTADERYAAGEKNARKITATPFDETNGTGFVSGEGIDEDKTTFTGKRLNAGTTSKGNTFDYTLKDGTVEITKEHDGNYIIHTKCGDLTITSTAEIEVWAKPGEWIYDGKDHTNSEFTYDNRGNENYIVTAITTEGTVKNVIKPVTNNNLITSVTVKNIDTGNEMTSKVKDGQVVTELDDGTKVLVHHSTLTVNPRTVTLTSEPLKKAFDGTYLTADERFAAGEKNARKITATPFDETSGTGFVSGEGIDEDKTIFTGKRLGVGTTLKGNTFDYTLKDGTTEYTKEHVGNYIIVREYGDLTITPPDEKFKIKIALKAQADGTGRDTTVIYDGVTQEANMDVHVTVSGDVEDTSILRKIIDALKNGTQKLFNAGVLVAHAEDRKPGEPLKVEKQTVTIEGLDITVDNLYVHGGAGIDTGDYPIILDYSKMTIDTTVDGEKIDLTKVVELEIDTIKGETQKYGVNPDLKTDEEIIGWLHVLPREVTLLSDTASKKYDGIPLTAKHVSETAYVKGTNKGFVPGEGVDYDITGSLLGSPEVEQNSVNTYNYVLKSNTKAINYKITPEYGKLTVTPLEGGDNPPEPTPDPPTPTPTPDDPSSDDPTPDNPTPDTPTTVTYIPPVVTTAVAPAPVAAVLGARREAPTNGAAVLGARRSKTSDETNDGARALVIVIAAGVALSLLFTRKKKNEEEGNS